MIEAFGGDEEIGEQIGEEYQTVDHSEIRFGDRVIFRYHHRAFAAQGGFCELPGVVLRVLPGYELVYLVHVCATLSYWPDLIVRRKDVTKVLPSC